MSVPEMTITEAIMLLTTVAGKLKTKLSKRNYEVQQVILYAKLHHKRGQVTLRFQSYLSQSKHRMAKQNFKCKLR